MPLKKLQSLKQKGPRDRNRCANICVFVCVGERERESMVAEIWNFCTLIWKDDIASAGQEQ